MRRTLPTGIALVLLAGLSGCGPSYSPDTYSSAAVQQANTVKRGVVVGVRQVGVSTDATGGTVTGAAAGGIGGAQLGTGGPITALSTLGGTVVGGLIGRSVEHAAGDTRAYEYIVRETHGALVSVTQADTNPLEIGQTVLVIAGKQARIVPDYTVAVPTEDPTSPSGTTAVATPAPTATSAPPAAEGPNAASGTTPVPTRTTTVPATTAAPAAAPAPPAGAATPSSSVTADGAPATQPVNAPASPTGSITPAGQTGTATPAGQTGTRDPASTSQPSTPPNVAAAPTGPH